MNISELKELEEDALKKISDLKILRGHISALEKYKHGYSIWTQGYHDICLSQYLTVDSYPIIKEAILKSMRMKFKSSLEETISTVKSYASKCDEYNLTKHDLIVEWLNDQAFSTN